MSIPAASGCTTSRLRSCAWIFRAHLPALLPVHLVPAAPAGAWRGLGGLGGLPCCGLLVASHGILTSFLEINPARPGGRKLLNLSIGVEPFPFSRRTPPPSTQPPTPEPRYKSDRNAPKKRRP